MNEDMIQVFSNPFFGNVRTTMIDDEPWLVGKDVAEALGYSNTQKAIRDHVDDEDKLTERIVLAGQHREVIFINESGLYSLILSSKLPSAKSFKRWVTSEVLPTLRRTGQYRMAAEEPEPETQRRTRELTPDDYIRAADIIARCTNTRLPIAMELLTRAGIEVDIITAARVPAGGSVSEEDAAHLRSVLQGYTVKEAAEITGLAKPVISRYRSGQSKPKWERYRLIMRVLAGPSIY